jgi:hypothetical protein
MLRSVAVLRTDVSEALSASIVRMTRIGELGTTVLMCSVVGARGDMQTEPGAPNCTASNIPALGRDPRCGVLPSMCRSTCSCTSALRAVTSSVCEQARSLGAQSLIACSRHGFTISTAVSSVLYGGSRVCMSKASAECLLLNTHHRMHDSRQVATPRSRSPFLLSDGADALELRAADERP